jgi:hypothetical protein
MQKISALTWLQSTSFFSLSHYIIWTTTVKAAETSGTMDKLLMQINDPNDLLNKRDRDMRHATSQLKSITVMPKEGLTLKQLAAQAALASGLHKEISASRRENEPLRCAARHRDQVALGDRAGRQLQALASAFAVRVDSPLIPYYQMESQPTTAGSILSQPEDFDTHYLDIYDTDSGISSFLSNQSSASQNLMMM